MAGKCQITGKKQVRENFVSHSKVKTPRVQKPNLQTKKIFVPELNRSVRLKLSTEAIRSIDKHGGLTAYLRTRGMKLQDII